MENSSRDGNTQPPYLPAEKSLQVKKQQLESGMQQWAGSKLGNEYVKAVYCHPAYLTFMPSTTCKMPGEISITSDMKMTPPLWQKAKRN